MRIQLRTVIVPAFLATIFCLPGEATTCRIVPLRTSVSIAPASAKPAWTIPIKCANGRTLYVLTRELDDAGGCLQGADLVLRRANAGPNADNLLAPGRNWHGMQRFTFAAPDFVDGPSKSVYGTERTIRIERLGLAVRIKIQNSSVSPTFDKDIYQLNQLDLEVEVDNLPHASGPPSDD